MRNFFQTTNWPQRHDKLHVYVLPDASGLEYAERFRDALTEYPAVSAMPRQYLHFTVQMIERFLHEVSEERITQLVSALDEAVRNLSPIELELTTPSVHESHVRLDGVGPATGFFELVTRVRSAIISVLGDDAVKPLGPGWGPHVSLGYGIADGENEPLARALEQVAANVEPARVRFDAVHLLSVSQHPDEGTFGWDSLAVIKLRA